MGKKKDDAFTGFLDVFFGTNQGKKKGGGGNRDGGNRGGGSNHNSRPPKEDNWREKSCPGTGGSYCGNTIKYRTDWDNIPDLCQSCKNKAKSSRQQRPERQQRPPREPKPSNWRDKACATPGCPNMVHYRTDWNHPPNFCDSCKEKRKQTKSSTCRGCGNSFEYPAHYDNPPRTCKNCKTKVDIFVRDLIPAGWKDIGGRAAIEGGKVTMFFPGKGTNGKGYRVSWYGQGNDLHWTDEGLPKDHPDRHKPPR